MRSARLRTLALGLLLMVVAAGCASDAPLDTLDPKGPEAQSIDNLLLPVMLIAGVVFLFVELGIVYLVVRFRRRKSDDDSELPSQTHGNLVLELGWTILPAVILAFVAVGTLTTLFEIDDAPEDALEIDVVGQQWWWDFQYDVDGDGAYDFRTANEMVIPAGEPVNLDITSMDVIHSFWIPALNGKKDAVPGRHHPLTLEADEPGTYWGQCTEFCGLSHANMRIRVIALPQDEYDAWLENQMRPAEAATGDAVDGEELFSSTCTSCHQIRGLNDDYTGAATVSGTAPELTHLMTRSTFAGSIFRLYAQADDADLHDFYTHLAEEGTFNRVQLEAWLRDPPAEKPMYADTATLNGALPRGMPDLELGEEQIDQLVAYLQTLD
ncbi:MAG: cytochrome c oxidase subunit II [Acidimicrobiales bacterium]